MTHRGQFTFPKELECDCWPLCIGLPLCPLGQVLRTTKLGEEHMAWSSPGLHGALLLQGSDLLGVHWQHGRVNDLGLPIVVGEL